MRTDRRPKQPSRPVVLAIDNDSDVLRTLTELLEREGFEVTPTGNGLAALECLQEGLRPKVIILDITMPVMDGWDFRAEQLRDPMLRQIPVVVVSASGFSAETVRAQFRTPDVLRKPIEVRPLLAVMNRLCRNGEKSS
jgi:CheY-like chemotaxis protein